MSWEKGEIKGAEYSNKLSDLTQKEVQSRLLKYKNDTTFGGVKRR